MNAPSTLDEARRFLGAKRIAIVGLSRDPKGFSRGVLRALVERGHDVVGVHPGPPPDDDVRWYPRMQDVSPAADAALIMTPPGQTERVLRDCAAAGISRVWLHRGAGPGAESLQALAFCKEHGIEAVHGLCPFMALPGAGLGHRVHAWFRLRKARSS
jgi:uncharacterized protein